MVRAGGMRLAGFCMSRGAGTARVRVRTQCQPQQQQQQQQYKQSYNSIFYTTQDKSECSSSSNSSDELNFNGGGDMSNPESEVGGNRVMVVVDSSLDAKGALQWALSHTVQIQDTIVLLHVSKPSKQVANSDRQKAHELLCSMKDMCQMRKPGVLVETAVMEGKEKGPTIVEEAKQQRVSLLVLGQRKRSMVRRLRRMWSSRKRSRSRVEVVEYCIQNANCMTIAVRRKSRKYGGYLITTKRHKNFWLLA